MQLSSTINLKVNGKAHHVPQSSAGLPLLWYLRDHLDLKGTKFGCGHGGCGACTIRLGGDAVQSCVVTVAEAAGKEIVTIEGLARQADHPIFRAWLAEQVPQCGYCQPGMIMATAALLDRADKPDDAEIDAALAHVLCRCGSYQRVRSAVHRAAEERWDSAPFPAVPLPPPEIEARGSAFRFNPWVTIMSDGTVVVTIERSEMGQGVNTSIAMLVAEELDVPLDRIRTVFAPVDHAYDNPVIGMQITVGSMSMQNAWIRVRHAGAEARARLIAAAAAAWNVGPEECRTENGSVIHSPSNRRADYGTLASAAASLPTDESVKLKSFDQFRILGKPTARLEIPAHIAGRSVFGMDVTLPGMLAATMILPPVPGDRPTDIDARKAKAIDGVRDVFAIGDGVAVVADELWLAFQARELVKVTWSGGDTNLSSAQIRRHFREAIERTGVVERETGDVAHVLAQAATILEAEYQTPYLAHAPIEPINCTVCIVDGHCDVWAPTQGQTMAQAAAAKASGLPLDAVAVHTTFLGGGFGRRSVPDFVAEAVEIAKATGKPIQLVWTRGDDIAHDRFRPAGLTMLRAALDEATNTPTGLFIRIAGPKLAFEGINIPYDIPHVRVECVEDDPGIPTGYWRSVGSSQNAFALEGFIDELAHATRTDPIDFRLKLLRSSPRHRAVLELAADKAGWGSVGDGRSQGVAVYYAHGGWAAQVAEISVTNEGNINVHRVVCAVDCGFAINPDTIVAQIEGGVAFGLTAALKSAITIEAGHAAQTGFRDYPILTIAEMPQIDVHLVPSREKPTGAGECGVPPIAPAVANALFAATGKRVRNLPIRWHRRRLVRSFTNEGVPE